MLQYYVNLTELDEEQLEFADADRSGTVDVDDALFILRCYVGLEEAEQVVEAPELDYVNQEAIALWDSAEEMPYYDADIAEEAASYMGVDIPCITPYIAENNTTGRAVIICPGGGYQQYSLLTEGSEIAEELNDNGISAFILQYRLIPYHTEAILSDVFRAIRYVRYYAEAFGIDPDQITVMGFSAGGHLALMSMEHYDDDLELTGDAIDEMSCKPNSGVLGYPVVSMTDELTHKTSRLNFLGEENITNTELIEAYSGELGVTEDTPPVFIWHCMDDRAVNYESSQVLADAFETAGVNYSLNIYKTGGHGIGIGWGTSAKGWFESCLEWLETLDTE